jgi:hypothetical protein
MVKDIGQVLDCMLARASRADDADKRAGEQSAAA